MRKREIKEFAKKLVTLSLDSERQVSPERVRDILQTLSSKPPRKLKPLLKQYYVLLRRELAQTQAVVEHSGELSNATLSEIGAKFSELTGRKVTAILKPNPALIAGVRVRVGDNVYEDSIATRLAALSHAVEA